MAWAVKYRLEIADERSVAWKIDIEEDAFGGSITDLVGGEDPLIFSWDNDSDDVFDPIKSSRAKITMKVSTDFVMADLYSTEDLQFRVNIYQNSVLFWTGYLMQNYSEPYECVPFDVTVTAYCGLEYLKDKIFKYTTATEDDTYYNGRTRESEIVINILGKIGYTGFTEYVNIYEESMGTTVDDSPFDQTYIDVDVFKDMYCYEVLQEILKKYDACIIHKAGGFVIYRPKELTGATVYGRIFTSSTAKSSTSFAPIQYINRTAHSTVFCQVPGGALITQRPAKKVTVYQDCGNKISWIDNWEFKREEFAGADMSTWVPNYWTKVDIAYAIPISNLIPSEVTGAILSPNVYPSFSYYIYQSFGIYATGSTDVFCFELDYLYYNLSGTAISKSDLYFYIKIKSDNSDVYLKVLDDEYLEWTSSDYHIAITSQDAPVGSSGWFSFKRKITGIPVSGSYTIRICGISCVTGASTWIGVKNIKFYSTSDSVIINRYKESYFPFVWSKWKETRKYTDKEEITQIVYEKLNSISGKELEYKNILGDVSGIDNIIEQFAGALATIYSLTMVAAQFVTDHAAAYLLCPSGPVIVTSAGNVITFNEPTGFENTTTITNLTGDLDGTVAHPSTYYITVTLSGTYGAADILCEEVTRNAYVNVAYTTDWNTRGGSESKPLLEIIGDEIAAQYARPKELIQMPIKEIGSAALALNIIGYVEDDVRKLSGNNRKFVFNRVDSLSVKFRRWIVDLIEII
jgi:hypothetical protein